MSDDLEAKRIEITTLLAYYGLRSYVEIEDEAVPMILTTLKSDEVIRVRIDEEGGLVIDLDDTVTWKQEKPNEPRTI